VILSAQKREPETASHILRYFLWHPEAADTLEGLAHWRLVEHGQHLTMEQIAEGLEWLVEQGYLKEISKPYADRIYSLDPEHTGDAERFLSESDNPG
jgi:hypothetical protein